MAKLEGAISNYLSKKLLDHALGVSAFTMPTTLYCGLASSSATKAQLAAGTLTNEITGYTGDRKAITFAEAGLADSENVLSDVESASSGDAVEFADMPACIVTWVLLCDAATVGNLLWALPLVILEGENAGEADPKTVAEGDTFRLPAGQVIAFIGQQADPVA